MAKAAYYEEANISYVTKSSRFLFRFNQEVKNYMVKNEKKAQNRHFHKKIQQRFLQGKYTRYVIVFFYISLMCHDSHSSKVIVVFYEYQQNVQASRKDQVH